MKLQFLITESEKKPRLEYVIQLIGNILGYPWELSTAYHQLDESGIVVSYSSMNSDIFSIKQPGINIFNSGQLYDLENAEKEISLFEYTGYSIPLIGKQLLMPPDPEWKELNRNQYYSKAGQSVWLTGIDLYTNIFFHLSRYEEKWRRVPDETSTDHSTSILSRYNQLGIPTVDILIHYLDQLIKLKINQSKKIALRLMNWPGGEEFGVALTHDVDLTRAVSFKKRIWKTGTGQVRKLFGDQGTWQNSRAEMDRLDAEVWSFPQIMDFYGMKKWKATFFFLAKRFEGIHYRYNLKSPQFQSLFDTLKNENHEIGLHSSLKAFDHQKRYQEEKQKLEKITRIKCTGLRQHYLRAKFPGLWKQAESAHFAYDSSLGYNYQAGFRAGTTHPFFTFDLEKDQPLSLVEFSLAFFEQSILGDISALESAQQILQNIIIQVSRFHGLLVALLHPGNFLQHPYRELWNYLISELDKRRVFVDTLSGHYKWYKFKEHIEISAERKNKEEEVYIIKKPIGLRTFSLEVIGNADLRISADAQIERIADRGYTFHTDKTRTELTLYRF